MTTLSQVLRRPAIMGLVVLAGSAAALAEDEARPHCTQDAMIVFDAPILRAQGSSAKKGKSEMRRTSTHG